MPVNLLAFLHDGDTIKARTLDDYQLDLAMRVILPIQNTRTATRVVRFRMESHPAEAMLANNAAALFASIASAGCDSIRNRTTRVAVRVF